jgi:hypothetical protein
VSGKPQGPAIKRECFHPKAKHKHGEYLAYKRDLCRCDECRAADATKRRANYRARAERAWAGNPEPYVPAIGITRRLQALCYIGWTSAMLEPLTGIGRDTLAKLRCGDRANVVPGKVAPIVRVYDALWDKPVLTEGGRKAAGHARYRGYLPPLAWDDETIDDPGAHPAVTFEASTELDWVLVERLMEGSVKFPPHTRLTKVPEIIEAIRRLAAQGVTDHEIGHRLNRTYDAVLKIRERNSIPNGLTGFVKETAA